MSDINKVLKGKYEGDKIADFGDAIYLHAVVTKERVASYTVLDETTKEEYSVVDGVIGQMLYGDMGFLAGWNGIQTKEYLIAIEWIDGEKSLIYLDDDHYKSFLKGKF